MGPVGPNKGDAKFNQLVKLVSVKATFMLLRQRNFGGSFH